MTKWQRKLMRWGLLLLLCYGATLIQLTLIRHADTVHHKEQSSRLPPGTRSTSSGRRITSVRRGQPWRQPRRQQQQQQRVESPPKPQELPLRIPPSSRKSQQPARNRTKGHLYLCINTKGRRVTLPRMPTFIIGGTQKGGTTALMKLIKMHPLIVDSKTFETHFFDYDEDMRKIRNFQNLSKAEVCNLRTSYGMKHFPVKELISNPQLLSFEKTPAYILDESTPAKIKAITPWAKVIFSLRNPIDRAFSHYRMLRTRNQIPESQAFEDVVATDLKVLRRRNYTIPENEPFPEIGRLNPRRMYQLWKAKNLVYRGLYVDQLAPWLDHFTLGKDLMVVQFERMLEHPHDVLDEILDFLGVHRHSYNQSHFNESYSPVVADQEHILDDATRDYLLRLYEPYNQQLAELLGERWKGVWNTTHY